MKNILYFEYPNTTGGSQIILYTILKNIDKTKYRPIVVYNSLNNEYSKLDTDKVEGVEYVPTPMRFPWTHSKVYDVCRKYCNTLSVGFRLVYWGMVYLIYDAIRFSRIVIKYDIHIIHTNNQCSHSLALPIVSKLFNIPLVAHLRGQATYPYGDVFNIANKIPKVQIAVSHHIKASAHNIIKKEENIHVIWDGIDGDDYHNEGDRGALCKSLHIPSGRKIIGFVGRIVYWKGVLDFIRCAKEAIDKYPKSVALVVGSWDRQDASYYRSVVSLAEELGIRDRVIFTGYRQDAIALINIMDVVVHCSVVPEPLGTTIMESMACYKPVVAYRSGGPAEEIVDNETGFLIDCGDIKALADKVAMLLSDEHLNRKMGENARKRYQQYFTGSAMTRQIEEIYDRLVL